MKKGKTHKWTLAARKKLSGALKRSWALRKKVTEGGIVHTGQHAPILLKTIFPQAMRDADSIIQRFSRMNDRAGEAFIITQLTKMHITKWAKTEC